MSFIYMGQKQLQAIDYAMQCLEGVTARIKNQEESDVYRLVRPDFDEGLQVALMPYESLFRNGALPWGDISTSTIQDYFDDLNDGWEELFSTLARRLADKTTLDHARTSHKQVHEIFKNVSTALPGTHVPTHDKSKIEKLRSDLSTLSKELCTSDITASQRRRKHPSRKCGRRGPQTEKMKSQMKSFKQFLTANGYDGNEKCVRSFAARCWHSHKDWIKASKAQGQKKGYASAASLANAYLKAKL